MVTLWRTYSLSLIASHCLKVENSCNTYTTTSLSGVVPDHRYCASKGLAIHSYQTPQRFIFQEHLAKSLTKKYSGLGQQKDGFINYAILHVCCVHQDQMLCPLPEYAGLQTPYAKRN